MTNEELNKNVLEQQQSAVSSSKDTVLVQGQLTLDDETVALLSKYYQGERLNTIKRQMNTILSLINTNVNRYNYSKDFKDAVDYTIALITAGKFL